MDRIENAYEQISEIAVLKAKEIYGETLPVPISERLNTELCHIKSNNSAICYLTAHQIVRLAEERVSHVSTRGAVGSSLVAFLLGISSTNPLKAHYYCPRCHYIYFDTDKADGFDLPSKECPVCKDNLKADGHDIPFETFMGYDGSKISNIDLRLSKKTENTAVNYLREVFGEDKVIQVGALHKLQDEAMKLNLIYHPICDLLELLEEYTGKSVETVNYNDPAVLEQFKNADTLAIAEFDSDFVKMVLDKTKPNSFSDLVKITGLSHGTNVWTNNAENLLKEGYALSELPANRDDILLKLVEYGIDMATVFFIVECVRKGRFGDQNAATFKCVNLMQSAGVEAWYIDALKKIRYMFPKAHAVSYTLNAVRCACFKHYYPVEYYAAYLTCFIDHEKEMTKDEMWLFAQIVDECAMKGIEILGPDSQNSHPKKCVVYNGNILLPYAK